MIKFLNQKQAFKPVFDLTRFPSLVLSPVTTTIATAESAPATSAESAPPLGSFTHRLGFIDGNCPFADLLAVHGLNSFHGFVIVGHFHESESTASA